jgi:hypothetical protein
MNVAQSDSVEVVIEATVFVHLFPVAMTSQISSHNVPDQEHRDDGHVACVAKSPHASGVADCRQKRVLPFRPLQVTFTPFTLPALHCANTLRFPQKLFPPVHPVSGSPELQDPTGIESTVDLRLPDFAILPSMNPRALQKVFAPFWLSPK